VASLEGYAYLASEKWSPEFGNNKNLPYLGMQHSKLNVETFWKLSCCYKYLTVIDQCVMFVN